MNEKSDYVLSLDSRKTLNISNADEVLSFTENKVVLGLSDGSLTVSGKNLRITNFSKTEETVIEGRINALTFSERKSVKSMFSKCIK